VKQSFVVIQKWKQMMAELRWYVRRGIALFLQLVVLIRNLVMTLLRFVRGVLTRLIDVVWRGGLFVASVPSLVPGKLRSINAERAWAFWKLNQTIRDLDVDHAIRRTEYSVKRAKFDVKRVQSWMLWMLLFGVVAFWVTRGVWLLPDRLIGGGDMPDWSGTAWAFWWTAEALGSGQNPFVATHNFFPVGQSPVSQYNLVDAILAAPLVWVFGTRVAYNLFATFCLVLDGFFTAVLARSVGATRVSAALAGLFVETSQFVLIEISDGRLSQVLLPFFLLGLLTQHRLAQGKGSRGWAVIAGFAMAATAITYWYYLVFLAISAIPLWLATRKEWDPKRLGHLGLSVGVGLVLCLPMVVRLMGLAADLPGMERPSEAWMDVGELDRGEFGLAVATVTSNGFFWPFVHTVQDQSDKHLSRVLIAVLIAGCWLRWHGYRQAKKGEAVAKTELFPPWRQWMWVAVLGWVFSLGPWAKAWDGTPVAVPLPFLALHDYVPYFSRFWWPNRFELLVVVGTAVAAALLLDRLSDVVWRRSLRRASPNFLPIVVLIAAISEIGAQLTSKPLPAIGLPAYDAGLYGDLEGALITLPLNGNSDDGRYNLWLQTYHGLPISGGLGDHLADHRPPGFDDFVQGNAVLGMLAKLSQGLTEPVRIQPSDVEGLLEAGFAWVVIDQRLFRSGSQHNGGAEENVQNQGTKSEKVKSLGLSLTSMWGPPEVESATGAAWRIRPISREVRFRPRPNLKQDTTQKAFGRRDGEPER